MFLTIRLRLSVTLLIALFIFLSSARQSALGKTSGYISDRNFYPKPPLPVVPSAGGRYRDPVFGADILRATDANDCPGNGCGTFYSHWPTFNYNNTRIFYRSERDTAKIKSFDAANFTVGQAVSLPIVVRTSNCTNCPAGISDGPSWESSIWSHSNADVIYTFSGWIGGLRIYTYNVSTAQFTIIKDLSSLSGVVPSTDYLHQMNMSADDDVFSFSQLRIGYAGPGDFPYYIVWKRSTDT